VTRKRTQLNEQRLQREVSRHFKDLEQEILNNLEEYWSEYQLLQGQINLIKQPITDSHEKYYQILEKYNKKEFQLGSEEGKRLVEYATQPYAEKGILDIIKAKARRETVFGTLKWTEQRLLEKVFEASQRTLQRVDENINQIITDGYKSGKGIDYIKRKIKERFTQLETWEASRIARTEIHTAHNEGTMKSYEEMNVNYTQWVAAHDNRVRLSHRASFSKNGIHGTGVDGEIIPMGGQYSNGLSYPGDTSGPIEEWINCRCSNAPFVIPYGYAAPVDKQQFREEDLIKL
jgi:SPP1 gp7 family putative phage head morphogenesis protein